MGYNIPTSHGLVVVYIKNPSQPTADSIRFGVLYAADPGTYTPAQFNAIANLFRDNLKGFWTTTWSVGPVKQYFNSSGTLFLSEDPTLEAGTGGGAPYSSAQVAQVVKKGTAALGRAHRGRIYVPGLPEADVDESGTITNAHLTVVNAAMVTLQTAVEGSADVTSMVLLHSQGSVLGPSPITSWTAQAKAGTIRKRVRR